MDDEIGHRGRREARGVWRVVAAKPAFAPRATARLLLRNKKASAGADALDAIRARRAGQGLSGLDAALTAAFGAFAPVAAATAATTTTVAALAARTSTPVAAFATAGISATLAAAIAAATMTTMTAFAVMLAVGAGCRGGGLAGRAAEEGLQPAEEAARFRGGRGGGLKGALGRAVGRTFTAFARGTTEVRRSRDVGVAGADVEKFLRGLGECDAFLTGRALAPLFTARTLGAGLADGFEAFALPSLGGDDFRLGGLEDVEFGRLLSRCLLRPARDLS